MNPGDSDAIRWQVSDDRIDLLIVEGLAEATGRRPRDIPPLHESVDLDALAAVVAHDGAIEVEFEHLDCTVRVADEIVTVSPN